MKIKKWFILAGGSATRWNNHLDIKNKCFIPIDGETLVDRTRRLLKENGISDITIKFNNAYKSKREAFEKIAKEAKCGIGFLYGDCYYSESIIKDAVNRDVKDWVSYYNCLPNPWTDCPWEEHYLHLVADWQWWASKMEEFNKKVDAGDLTITKDFQIYRYLHGYSVDEFHYATLDEHHIFWRDETDDIDFPSDYHKFMLARLDNRFKKRFDRFSIIIPHYNTSDRLFLLLKNLVEQKKIYYPETEIIVVDDGSSEDMSWLNRSDVENWRTHVTTIFQPNRGAAAARNVGLMASTGKYIAFADADDNIEPNYLHTLYHTMRDNDCDYATFPFIVELYKSVAWPRDELIGSYGVWGWAFTWDCINGERFDENLNVAEDVDWLKRVVTKDKSRFQSTVPIYRYDWNANPNSLSKRFNRGELPKHKS